MMMTKSWIATAALLAFPLTAGVVACSSSSDTGGGATTDDGGGGGGGDTDGGGGGGDTDGGGGGGGGTKKSGAITLTSSTFKVGPTTISSHAALAFFSEAATSDTSVTANCTTSTDGSCSILECQAGDSGTVDPDAGVRDAGAVKAPTAGEIDITGGTIPAAGIKLVANASGVYTADTGQTAIWAGGEDISVKAAGDSAGCPAFDQTVKAPASVTVTAPTWPTAGKPLTVDRATALALTWTGGGAGDVSVSLTSASAGKSTIISCKFPSAGGSGTIAASTLGKLSTGTGTVSASSSNINSFTQGDWSINLSTSTPALAGASFASGTTDIQ